MRTKLYLVLRNTDGGGVDLIAARLTQGAAEGIASRIPGAYVDRWFATKEEDLTEGEMASANLVYEDAN